MALVDDLAIQLANDTGYSIGSSLFKQNLPPTPDKAIAVINPMGEEPDKYLPLKSPMIKVLIRDTNTSNGMAKLAQVRSSLHQKTNQTIGSTYFYYILAVAEGGWIGRDEDGRDLFSINFRCETR